MYAVALKKDHNICGIAACKELGIVNSMALPSIVDFAMDP